MEAVAKASNVRQSARKVRQVLDLVRGLPVERALNELQFSPKKAARTVGKIIQSAVANAVNRPDSTVDADKLYISEAFADEGPRMRRFRARAQGRVGILRKPSAHITIKVAEKDA
jgi:large subunit ribosomal protein L22